jgi:hypothetical protein
MTATITAWLALTMGLGLMASIAIWSRRPTHARGLAVASFIPGSALAAVALAMALGWPIPYLPGITVPEGEHTIIGFKMAEGEGIYILLDTGGSAPRYYRLPWKNSTAEALQNAQGEGEGDGEGESGEFGMSVPGLEWSWDDNEPQFWAAPQPQMPPKQAGPAAPHFEGGA